MVFISYPFFLLLMGCSLGALLLAFAVSLLVNVDTCITMKWSNKLNALL
jgi:hypothetical protein